jgi:glycosyltransferase involved in cell wall biosynthesis
VDGGIETHARELYPRLAATGECVVTVLTRRRYDTGRFGDTPAGVLTTPLPAFVGKGVEALTHSALAALHCIARRPDLVHVHGIGPALFAPLLRACGLRVVVTHHGHDYEADKWGRAARLLLRLAERVGVRSAHAVITVSESLRRDVLRDFGVRSTTVYNGCVARADLARSPSATDPRLDALEPERYVVVVGRVTPHKRVHDVLAAFAALEDPHLRLVVCGTAPPGDAYGRRIESQARGDPRVILAGFVPPDKLRRLYSDALCTVMASSYEGMPLAVLEALSCGSRVILSAIAAHEEIGLTPEHYFECGDVAGLTQRLRGVLAARAAGERAPPLPLGPAYDWSHIALQTLAVFRNATAPQPRA